MKINDQLKGQSVLRLNGLASEPSVSAYRDLEARANAASTATEEEIATALGVSHAAVSKTISRSLRRLCSALSADDTRYAELGGRTVAEAAMDYPELVIQWLNESRELDRSCKNVGKVVGTTIAA